MSSQGLIIKKSVPNEPLIPKQPKKTLLKSGKRNININKFPYLSKIIRKPIEITNRDGNIITTEKTERGKDGFENNVLPPEFFFISYFFFIIFIFLVN